MKIVSEHNFGHCRPMNVISVLFQSTLNYNFWFAEFFSWELICRCVGFSFIDRRKSVELGSNALTAIIWRPCTHKQRRIMLQKSPYFIFTINSNLTLDICLQLSLELIMDACHFLTLPSNLADHLSRFQVSILFSSSHGDPFD